MKDYCQLILLLLLSNILQAVEFHMQIIVQGIVKTEHESLNICMYLPGHACELQIIVSEDKPKQGSPPLAGSGSVHCL